jgi:hypothetical protein
MDKHFNIVVKDAGKIDHLAALVSTYRLLQRLKPTIATTASLKRRETI